MNWEIFTYGGGEFLRLVFNGIAAITGNGDYISILKVSAMIGILWVLIEGAFNTHRGLNWQWLLVITLVYNTAMVPKSEVIITDRIDASQSGVVANVPLGLAAFAGTASLLGDWITRTYETVFSLPNDLQYAQNGMIFGQRLVEASTHFEITDQRMAGNLSEFWQNCVFYDILLGLYTWDDLMSADDLWGFVQANTSLARTFVYTATDGTRSTLGCRAGAASDGALNADLTDAIQKARDFYGQQLVKDVDPTSAITRFAAAMPVSYDYLTGLSLNAEQIIRQNALANSIQRGITQFAARTDADAAAQDFAIARAEQERRTTYAVLGELAAKTLPLLRNLFEAFIYAIFPIVFLFMMLPTVGKVALTYLKSVAWIQLWAPLYAVIHFAVTFFAQYPAQTSMLLPDGTVGLALANHSALGQVMSDVSLIAGYLSISIPMIAYLVVNQGGAMMAGLAGSVMRSYESPVSAAAHEASAGNITLGNTNIGNQVMHQRNVAPSNSFGYALETGPDGTRRLSTPDGVFRSYSKDDYGNLGLSIGKSISSGVTTQATHSLQAAQTSAVSFAKSDGATYTDLARFAHQTANDTNVGNDWTQGDGAAFRREFGEVQSLTQEFATQHKLDHAQASQILGLASLAAQNPKLVDWVSPIRLGGELQISGRNQAQLSQMWQDAMKFAHDRRYGEQWSEALDAGHRATASYQERTGDAFSSEIAGGVEHRATLARELSARMDEAQRWEEARARVERSGLDFSMQAPGLMRHWLVGREKDDLGISTPNSISPVWTEREVDTLVGAFNRSEPWAIDVVAVVANRMTKDPGLVNGLVEMAPAPMQQVVHAAYGANSATVERTGSGVTDQGHDWRRNATEGATLAGIPAASAVMGRFGNTVADTVSSRNTHTDAVSRGERQVEQEGAEQQSAVRTSADPNRSLISDAIGNAADTVGGWGRDALDTLAEALPSTSRDHSSPTTQREDQNPVPVQPGSPDRPTPADVDNRPDDLPDLPTHTADEPERIEKK